MKIRATIIIEINSEEYAEKDELNKNSDAVRALVNDMLDGGADLPEDRNIHVEYLEMDRWIEKYKEK